MQRIILLQMIAFAIGFYMSKFICAAVFIHNSSTKERLSTFEQKNKKCIYVNSLFSNTCPFQPFDGYKNLYEKSYQMELLEFHKKECFRKPDLFPVFALIIIITMSFINCLCF